MDYDAASKSLIDIGCQLYAMGMVPATSGNFSARLDDGAMAITVSGAHKGKLTVQDIMRADMQGVSLDGRRPSAETCLHTQIYSRYPDVNIVIHPHSINATVLSKMCDEWLILKDYELLKAFPGIKTHDCTLRIPVFENDQDIDRLASKVDVCMQEQIELPGYLIRGHGFYTWGGGPEEVMKHIEAFEFLFNCEIRMRGLGL